MTVSIKLDYFDHSKAVEFWKQSDDSILVRLAENIEEAKTIPSEEEMIEILTFFSVFSMGCLEMGLKDIAKAFEKRATSFIIGLRKMGLVPGKYKNYVLDCMLDGYYNRVINTAAYRAAYRFCDLSRDVKEPKPVKPLKKAK